jgi:hypothetical membrane protein
MADLKCYAEKCGHGLSVICLSTLAGILAPLIFLMVMAIVESLQPGYNAIQEAISKLVLGLYGWSQTLSFFIVGALLVIFAFRLYIATLRKNSAKAGLFLFTLSGISFFLLGAFPLKPDGVTLTVPALAHYVVAGISIASFILGCSVYTVYFRADRQWSRFWLYTMLTAIACLVSLALWVITPQEWLWKGLSERLLVVTSFVWVEIVSVRLLRFCLHKEPNRTEGLTLSN